MSGPFWGICGACGTRRVQPDYCHVCAGERSVITLGDLHVGDVFRHDDADCTITGKTQYVGGPHEGSVVIRYVRGPFPFSSELHDMDGRHDDPVVLVRRREVGR